MSSLAQQVNGAKSVFARKGAVAHRDLRRSPPSHSPDLK